MHGARAHTRLLAAAVLALVAWPSLLYATEIAIVRSRDLPAFDQVLESFDRACDIRTENYNLDGKEDRADDIVAAIRKSDATLTLAVGLLAANELRARMPDMPMLYCMVSNPHRYGLTGKNVVGISLDVPGARQFELYRTVVPGLRRVGVIFDPEKSGALVEEAAAAAEALGITLVSTPVSSHKRVPGAFRGMLGRIDALWMVPDDTVITMDSFRFLLVTSLENKLPLMAVTDIFVKFGALATIVPDPSEVGRQICEIVRGIERGDLDIADVDVLPPAQAHLVLNSKTAKKIGLEVSKEVLDAASKVYE